MNTLSVEARLRQMVAEETVITVGNVEGVNHETGAYKVRTGLQQRLVWATCLGPAGDASLLLSRYQVDDEVLLAFPDGPDNPVILGALYNPVQPFPGLREEGLSIQHPDGVYVASGPETAVEPVVHGPLPQDLRDGWKALRASVLASPAAISGAVAPTSTAAQVAIAAQGAPPTAALPATNAQVAATAALNKAYTDAVVTAMNNRFTAIANDMASFEAKLDQFEQYVSDKLYSE